MLLRLNCHVVNLSASLKISLLYQAVYYYLLDNPVSGPSFVPTIIAALHPSNIYMESVKMLKEKDMVKEIEVNPDILLPQYISCIKAKSHIIPFP